MKTVRGTKRGMACVFMTKSLDRVDQAGESSRIED